MNTEVLHFKLDVLQMKNCFKSRLMGTVLKSSILVLFLGLEAFSCKKESLETISKNTETIAVTQRKPIVKPDSSKIILSVNWNNRANGAIYTESKANTDFTNISGWNQNLAFTTMGKDGVGCRATLLPNTLTNEGLYGSVNIPKGSEYEMDYDVKFDKNFNWGFGGKVGFGFLIGNGNTGGVPAWDGNGGSLRLMWFSPKISSDRVYFQPYLYYKDMNGGPASGDIYGDVLGISYPTSGSLIKGQWYHIHMYVKSNTGSNKNGHVQIAIDGNIILDQQIRWTTNDSERLINTITFNTFRGGGDVSWETSTTDYVYYDNLIVQKIN